MKKIIVQTSQLVEGRLDPAFYLKAQAMKLFSEQPEHVRDATRMHYRTKMAEAQEMRIKARALLDAARDIEMDVAELKPFLRRE